MANAFNDILGFAGKAADAVLLGGAIGKTKRRNQFTDFLEQGQFDQAQQLALRSNEPQYAAYAQQQAALGNSQQETENQIFSGLSIALSEITDPNARRMAFEAMKPGLSQRFGLDDEDFSQVPLDDPNALRLFGQQFIDPKDQRAQALTAQAQAESARSNRATEGLRGGELDVSRGNLSLRRQEFEQGSNGISLTTPDGSVVQVGGRGPGLGVKGKNDLDTRRINSADQLQRLNQITSKFDEKFLRSGPRLNNLVVSLKDKGILPGDLSKEDEQSLVEFSEFRQAAFNNLNNTLREMSGAAITPQEAERLIKSLPNPGKGVFDGDSPTQFKSKTDAVTKQLKLAIARYNYASATGNVDAATSVVSLDQMRSFINEQAQAIEQQLRQSNPGATEEQIQSTVRAEIRRLFGSFQ